MKAVFNFLFLSVFLFSGAQASEPTRVIALLPSIAEVVYEVLDKKESLIAVSNYSDFPEAVKKIQTIGPYHHFNVEKIVSLKPDVVFASKDGNNADQIKQLEENKIKLCFLKLNSLKDIEKSYRDVGAALNRSERGGELSRKFRDRVETLRAQSQKSKSSPSVFVQISQLPLITLGGDSYINELLSLIPLKNAFINQKTDYFKTTAESVIQKNPDFILVFDMNNEFKNNVTPWEKFTMLSAVKNQKVIRVQTDEFLRPTMRALVGVELLKAKITEKKNEK